MLITPYCRSAHQIKSSLNLAFIRSSSSKDKTAEEAKPVSSPVLQTGCAEASSTESGMAGPSVEPVAEFPEEPTTCCMSGCANCVWLDYTQKVSAYYKDGGQRAIKEINEKVTDPNIRAFLLQEIKSTLK